MFELGKKIEAFANKTPVAVLVRAVLQRDLNPKRMDELFHSTAERQYEKTLLFSTVMILTLPKQKNRESRERKNRQSDVFLTS